MGSLKHVALCVLLLHTVFCVKVKVVMHSEQDDSKIEDEETPRPETWDHKKKEATMLPFIKKNHKHVEEKIEFEEDRTTTDHPAHQLHPNDMIFPLIYRQNHVNSMFKFGENWYTWSIEKRTDGSKAINYFICYDEPKHCDDIGWLNICRCDLLVPVDRNDRTGILVGVEEERTDTLPKCAFQIDSLLPDDRACINSFGVEPHTASGVICDGGEQMKVSEMVRSCGPRIRSLWRFFRVGRRPVNAAKPADVNSLVCEDEEECYITIEYRIHHDRITFSLHEPTRGQTFKSSLKRDRAAEEEKPTTETHIHVRKSKKREEESVPKIKKFHTRTRAKTVEGKGVVKERNDSGYRRSAKNKIKIREDVSDDLSE